MNKKLVGILVGGLVANKAWKLMSVKTFGKALECLRLAENLKERELVKRVYDKDLMYSDLTKEEWQELRDLLSKMVKEYKRAYRLISITKVKRKAESIIEIATLKADMKNAINVVEEKIKELDEFLEANKQ